MLLCELHDFEVFNDRSNIASYPYEIVSHSYKLIRLLLVYEANPSFIFQRERTKWRESRARAR